MVVVTSQRWTLRCLNLIHGCFFTIPLGQPFLPGIWWLLILDINGTFLYHTHGWTLFLHTMVVFTGARWKEFSLKEGTICTATAMLLVRRKLHNFSSGVSLSLACVNKDPIKKLIKVDSQLSSTSCVLSWEALLHCMAFSGRCYACLLPVPFSTLPCTRGETRKQQQPYHHTYSQA